MRILYFAWVRERIGRDEERVAPPDGIADIGALVDWLASRNAASADALADRTRLRAAVDGRMAGMDDPLAGVSEVALFPPVTGG